jgi:glycosyltransferase involved in cell wall biosynthesis
MPSSTATRTTPPSASAERAISLVLPWCGEEIRGGAELQGWETARELSRRGHRVEVLTTCSRSFLHRWDDNHHPPGVTVREGVTVRRFRVDPRSEEEFGRVNGALLTGGRLTAADEEVFVAQNINSADLCRHIGAGEADRRYLFLPYLYGTTLRGAAVRPERSFIMPCFHDEPYGYLAVTGRVFRGVRGLLYLTPEEGEAVDRVVGPGVRGRVVGGGIDTHLGADAGRFRASTGLAGPFILYVGRLDRGKNTHLLVEYFRRWRRSRGSDVRLALMGGGPLEIPAGDDVVRLGTLGEQEKLDACAASLLLCQPSVNESFSRVIMETWLARTPVVVHGACDVTREHVRRSGGGLFFGDWLEFAEVCDLLLGDGDLRRRMGEAGRRYVLEHYAWDVVVPRLLGAMDELDGDPGGEGGERAGPG